MEPFSKVHGVMTQKTTIKIIDIDFHVGRKNLGL
jgi:hypothetical protein